MGQTVRYWTREWIIDACRAWNDQYGAPPRADDWNRARTDSQWPSKTVVALRFGTWNTMMEAAGFEPRDRRTASLHWTQEVIIDACQSWAERNGRPPFAREWYGATPESPNAVIVLRRFGTWNAMLEAAGFLARTQYGSTAIWTKESIAASMLDWLLVNGRWPTCRDWDQRSANTPSTTTVRYHFGSWNAAKKYAGWDPNASSRPVPFTGRACAGCGGDHSGFTTGCKACHSRRHKREKYRTDAAYRAQTKNGRRERYRRAKNGSAPSLAAAPGRDEGTVGAEGGAVNSPRRAA